MVYLRSYGYFLQWTCKKLAAIPIDSFSVEGGMVYHNDIKMLNYLEKHDLFGTCGYPQHLEAFKWLLKRGYVNTSHAYADAIRLGKIDMIDYCLKKRFTCTWAYRACESVNTIKYLWKKQVPVGDSVWTNGFYMSVTEDMFLWYLRYPEIPSFSFVHFMESLPFNERLKVLVWNAYRGYMPKGRYKSPRVISLLCEQTLIGDDDLIPMDVCQNLPYDYAIHIYSEQCECNEPSNHENRKRIKC